VVEWRGGYAWLFIRANRAETLLNNKHWLQFSPKNLYNG
jgi:hypothetical protein